MSPTSPLRILLVEDAPLDAELVEAELRGSGHADAVTRCVETRAGFEEQLATVPDVILCDYQLRDFTGLEALHLMREKKFDIPFILISGSIGEEIAVEAMRSGANDYLLKDRLGRLGPAISRAVEEKNLRTAARRAEEDLRQSEVKYRSLFEHMPDAAYLCDANNGRIIDTNQRGEKILGRERAAILGTRLQHLIPLEIWQTLLVSAEHPAETLAPIASELSVPHGQRIPVLIRATAITLYNHRLLLTFFRER